MTTHFDWRCPECGWMIDTPEHQLGCEKGRADVAADLEKINEATKGMPAGVDVLAEIMRRDRA